MLFKTSLRIIVNEKEKFSGAVAGVALATFLMILQCGFYLGYDRDITVVLDSIDALLSQHFDQVPPGEKFAIEVCLDNLAVLHQHCRRSFEHGAGRAAFEGGPTDKSAGED